MEMIKRSRQQGVPVVATEDEVIVGFDERKMKKLAEKYGKAKRAPLGLLAADAEPYLAKHPDVAKKLPAGIKGVYVGEVRPGSVAEKAGLKPGDVIVSVANKRVRSTGGLDQLIDTLEAGQSIDVRLQRGKEEQTATLQF